MMGYQDVLARLKAKPRPGGGWVARCPAHEDRHPSLTIDLNLSDRLLLCCHRGCHIRAITQAIGLPLECYGLPKLERASYMANQPMPKIVATYDYVSEAGKLLYQAVRYEPKDFRVRRPDGKGGWEWNLDEVWRVPYNLSAILAKPNQPVFVVEGEKDVETLRKWGFLGTTNVGGAGKWGVTLGHHFRGRRVAILPDNDRPGEDHALMVAASLLNYASEIRIVHLPGMPDKGDVTDWLSSKLPHQSDEDVKASFLAYVKSSPTWKLFLPESRAA